MRKSLLLIATTLPFLWSCQSAPRVMVQAICPAIPSLGQQQAQQEPTFTDRMANFLQGKLPEQTNSASTSSNANVDTTLQKQP